MIVYSGLRLPTQTAAAIVSELNRQINTALGDPKIKARLADLGSIPMPMTPTELLATESKKWTKVVISRARRH